MLPLFGFYSFRLAVEVAFGFGRGLVWGTECVLCTPIMHSKLTLETFLQSLMRLLGSPGHCSPDTGWGTVERWGHLQALCYTMLIHVSPLVMRPVLLTRLICCVTRRPAMRDPSQHEPLRSMVISEFPVDISATESAKGKQE